ncbi:MAG TPA: DNA methyltransferase [Solirubrobacteraceae bacterium]|nr:DNA methyltransferase [Solirubrobacteraceae bacterium]
MNPVNYLETGVLHCGDNLHLLGQFPAECIDMIYLDPPFFTNREHEVIWGDEAEIRAFDDRWEGGIQVYLDWMERRLRQMHRILRDTGSLYLHCDPTAGHYLKVMLDDIFGSTNRFRSEVVWKRTSAHSGARRYGPVHDTIFFYTKSDEYTWNQQYQPLPQETIDAWYNNVEPETGRRFNRADLTAKGTRKGPSGQPWRGIDPTTKGRHWAIPGFVKDIVEGKDTLEALDALDEAGRLFWPKREGGMPMVKRYIEESRGVPAQDVITHISPLKNVTTEREGYPTQKPEALLEVFIRASTKPGDVVLDPFCGCGTTVAVAHRLQREWIGIDISPQAVEIMKRRVSKLGAAPVTYGLPETVDDLRRLDGRQFQRWLIGRVLAEPSPTESHDMGIDGYSYFDGDPIQVKKSEGVGRNVVDNFETAVERSGHDKGYIVAFSFTKNAVEETARARREKGIDIRLVKVEQVLEVGHLIDVAANEGRTVDTGQVTQDLMGLFRDLQDAVEARTEAPSREKKRRNRDAPQQRLPGVDHTEP